VLTPTPDLCYFVAILKAPVADPAQAATYIYRQALEALGREEWRVVHERVFGSLQFRETILCARRDVLRHQGIDTTGPLTYVQGQPLWGHGLAGVQIRAVRLVNPADCWTIQENQVCYGRGWRQPGATYLLLQNLHGLAEPKAASKSGRDRREQTSRLFDRARSILRGQGASYSDVARTWIYLSRILDWYGEFNGARNHKYQEFGLMPQSMNTASSLEFGLPASTGIQGENPLGAAAVMDLLAIVGDSSGSLQIDRLSNERQKDAFRYGAAFSRGTLIRDPALVQFQISGTAAIDEHGISLSPGDARAQIQHTLDNLAGLMAPAGTNFSHVCSATAFLKRPEDVPIYQAIMAERGLAQLPAVCMVADICRPELLFELDAEAAWPQ
jgi:enamine deaminase RidA (YjgF/YER057c/UK114 family)